jgi:hypothetical protein
MPVDGDANGKAVRVSSVEGAPSVTNVVYEIHEFQAYGTHARLSLIAPLHGLLLIIHKERAAAEK